jgi:predicted neuraminidase
MTPIFTSRPSRGAILTLLVLSLVATSTDATVADSSPAIISSEFIYETAPTPSCHASTLVETTAGTLVVAWFGGTAEGKPDVGIWLSRRETAAWSAPIEVASGLQATASTATSATAAVRYPCWNPVLFQPTKGPLLLFYKVGPSPAEWWGMLRTSDDDGRTWSTARRLPDGILGPIKNKPTELSDGTILSPSSTETKERPSKWRVHFERSADFGITWQATAPVNDGLTWAAIQPSLLKLEGDKLLALGRSRQGKLFQIVSDDGGKTWGPMTAGNLPNPNSGTDAVTLREPVSKDPTSVGVSHFLVYNHTPRGRTPLNLAASADGVTWQAALVLEDEPKREFSYPAVIQTRDGLLHVTYTWKRSRIRHVMIDTTKLMLQPIVDGAWPK